MNEPFTHLHTFTLNKQYLTECYEESTRVNRSLRAYSRAIVTIAVAAILFRLTEVDTYIAIFILVIGVIDATNVYYHKAWWLARQVWGSSYNSSVILTINEEGIATQSPHIKNKILWADVKKIELTEKGLLVHHSSGKDYLSNSCLTDSAITYINDRTNNISK